MPLGHRDGFSDSYFDSKSFADSYTAMDTQTTAVSFIVRNLTGKEVLIRKGASGDSITIANGFESPLLKGNPSGYQLINNTDSATVTAEIIYYEG